MCYLETVLVLNLNISRSITTRRVCKDGKKGGRGITSFTKVSIIFYQSSNFNTDKDSLNCPADLTVL